MLSVLGSLFGSASDLVGVGVPCDDGFSDRLNHNWTTFLLTFFCLVITTTQFAGSPIKCWISKDTDHADYIHNACWVKNTYDAPLTHPLPVEEKERLKGELKYYQWLPLILLVQALMFKMPNMIWKLCQSNGGINIEKITSLSQDTQYSEPKKRATTINNIAAYIHSWLIFERERRYTIFSRMRHRMSRLSILFFPLGSRNGTYLVGLYFFSKILYLANAVGQYFLLNALLGFDFTNFGVLVFTNLLADGEVKETRAFPRVTYCDVKIRQQQNILTYTYQCVLSINMLSEKIFAILWFWLLLLVCVNAVSTLMWCYNLIFRRNRVRYVEKYLSLFVNVADEKELCRKFIDDYIRDDGVLVLRAVANNSSIMVLGDIVQELWRLFIKNREIRYERKEQRKQELENRDKMEMEVIADEKHGATTQLRKLKEVDL
ncbi:innexin unc-9-like [Haliotis rufescens]|uniref:innexin unc-9-like n=1 Tax=Haliotis rufescens TaxID=6454 RepID=UPI001EAFAF7E|nr:innexin unc-9-like [Haliotis rufescens]